VRIATGSGGNVTITTDHDLTTDLVDLTHISLDELWDLNNPDLTAAIKRTRDAAEFNTGNEVQDQRG
jgi:hypothetical protein